MIYVQLAAPTVSLAAFLFALVLFLRDRRLVSLVLPLLALVLFLDTLPAALPVRFAALQGLEAVLHLSLASLAFGALVLFARTGQEKVAEQRGRLANEARTAAILEAAIDAVILIDGSGVIHLANPAVEVLLGHRPADVVGQNVSMLMDSPDREAHDGYLERFLRTGERRIIGIGREVLARHRDGRAVPVHLSVSRLQVEGVPFFAGTLHDLSALRAKTAELERSNEDLQQFAYVASHDLQEPLRMVASYVQLLERRYRGRLDQNADEFIGFAVEGAKRMQTLINDLLSYSRVGMHGATFREVDLGVLFAQVLEDLQLVMKAEGATVERGALPVLWADETQMRQLLLNLIGNALKFRRKTEAPVIRVTADRDAQEWRICFRDNGIGFEPRFRERIFTIFQRLHPREDYPGTGLGLALCRRIVEGHGGRIWAESELGQGALFTVSLPENRRLS